MSEVPFATLLERRLSMQLAIARTLAASTSLAQAAPALLEAIARAEGFQAAAIWQVDVASSELRCLDFWGVQSFGFAGDVTVGFPLGFQLTIQTTAGGSGALSVGAVAGVDLLRLTLYRTALLDSFPNPSSPVRRPSEPARAALSF